MEYRTFGRTGWRVSEMGFGTWGMGGWTGSDDVESAESLDRAVELGWRSCGSFAGTARRPAGHSSCYITIALGT